MSYFQFNGEDLSCEYSVGKKVYSDSLTLMVFDFSVSGEKIFAPEVKGGRVVNFRIVSSISNGGWADLGTLDTLLYSFIYSLKIQELLSS